MLGMGVQGTEGAAGGPNGRVLGLSRNQVVLAALLAILAAALALRLYGIAWDSGYPWTPHPDERAILQHVDEIAPPPAGDLGQLLDEEKSTWNPKWFPYGSLPLYLLKGVELVYDKLPAKDLTDLRVPGRTISALADVLTILVAYLLASRLFGRRVGLAAAGLLAVAVLHIQLSHFYAVDTLLTLFAVASVFFMYRVATQGKLRDSLLAGLFIGLGLATKTSLLPIFIAFGIAHVMYVFQWTGQPYDTQPGFLKRLEKAIECTVLGLVVAGVAFFIAEPYAFLDWTRFSADWVEQSEMVQRIRDYPYTRQYINTPPYWYQVQQLATWGLGWPLGVVAWAGLAFAALRGLRWRHAALYVAGGVALPMAMLLLSHDTKVMALAGLVAGVALLATLPVRRPDTRLDVLLLAWVVPYFLIIGAFEVKFLRYLLPITPFLVVLGVRMAFALWDGAHRLLPRLPLRPALLVLGALVVAATAFYAASYMAVYAKPHPAVSAAAWMKENAPDGSSVLKEHWEESLPELHQFRWEELPMYEPDGRQKLGDMSRQLSRADYLVFYSNRMYANLPRLPWRYPTSGEYYDLLFSGRLGYELVHYETSYPTLWSVSFADDTFNRPGVPAPQPLENFKPSPLTLGLGFADESFTVYDHPKVLIFQNVKRYDSLTIARVIETSVDGGLEGREEADPGPVYTPEDAAAQQRGGTWREIIREESWTNRMPVLAWLIVVEGLSLLALPLTLFLFRPLPDRGYLLAKAVGLLAVGLVVWWLASLKWMAFSSGSIMLAAALLAGASGLVLAFRRREILAFLRENWRVVLIGEAVFLTAFFSFVAIRMANPDLWHPYRGGEKPMELAYLNAVIRSSYMPPYDPWFSGGYLNYYYWGQFLTGMLVKATGIDVRYAFNLAVPLFFALTVAGAFCAAYNLAEATRQRLTVKVKTSFPWSPVLAGLAAAVLVTVLGNLDGAMQMGHAIKRAAFLGEPYGTFDFWQSSRMMPPDPPGFEITEFPYFTFLFADLHPHLMAMPFTLLVVALALAVVLKGRAPPASSTEGGVPLSFDKLRTSGARLLDGWLLLAALGIAIGALRAINTWDYPTYLVLGVGAVFLAGFFRHGGLSLWMVAESAVRAVFVYTVAYVAFLPFLLNNKVFFDSLEATTNRTILWHYLAITGLFVFILGTFLLTETRDWLASAWRGVLRLTLGQRLAKLGEANYFKPAPAGMSLFPIGVIRIAALALVLAGIGYAIAVWASAPLGSTVPFLALLLALLAAVGARWLFSGRPDAAPLAFMGLMAGLAFALGLGLDLYRVEGDIDRMNSIFKVYLQVWVLLGVASAYALWRLSQGVRWSALGSLRLPMPEMGVAGWAWAAFLLLLVASAGVYTLEGTQERLRDRFDAQSVPLTLDGMAYMRGAVYGDEKGELRLWDDYPGIRWLQENVEGSPVIMEGHTPTYRWGNRVSIYTGLPAVVGWQWHQEQQRWDYQDDIAQRIFEVKKFYETPDPSVAIDIALKYNVQYIYVGPLERAYYPAEGIQKFDYMAVLMDKVCCDGTPVDIYRIKPELLQTASR